MERKAMTKRTPQLAIIGPPPAPEVLPPPPDLDTPQHLLRASNAPLEILRIPAELLNNRVEF
jgi:hypothetical protein